MRRRRRAVAPDRQLDDGIALPGDDVGGGHDQIRLRDPAGAFDADPAGQAEHAHDARRSAADADGVREARVRRRDLRCRDGDGRERVDACQRIQHVGGRDQLIEPLQQRRPLSAAPKVGLPGEQERDRPEHPHDRYPCESPEDQPTGCVERADPLPAHPRAERRPDQCPDQPWSLGRQATG